MKHDMNMLEPGGTEGRGAVTANATRDDHDEARRRR